MKGGYVYIHSTLGMLGWTTLVCMTTKALHAASLLSRLFSLSSVIL